MNDTPSPPRRLRRLDCPRFGPLVELLSAAPENFAKVRSLNRGICFDTPVSRLHRIVTPPDNK